MSLSFALEKCPKCQDENSDLMFASIDAVDSPMGGTFIEMLMECEECGTTWIEYFHHAASKVGDWITEGGDSRWTNLTTGATR
jgi:uncharacterized Zn finger protein